MSFRNLRQQSTQRSFFNNNLYHLTFFSRPKALDSLFEFGASLPWGGLFLISLYEPDRQLSGAWKPLATFRGRITLLSSLDLL